jgi:DNA helicase II / ATP-dependent DNA helicase PcrA
MSTEYVLQPSGGNPHSAHIDYAAELNPDQYAAVTAKPGPILVIAGAGSGKTRTLTYRVAYLVENGVEPENILLLTFTNKAAKEMLGRVASLLPHDISRLWGGTFHHVGHRILRRHANKLGYGSDFTILDADDSADLAADCLGETDLPKGDKRLPKGDVLTSLFGLAVNKEEPIEKIIETQFPYFSIFSEGLSKAWRLYRERKLRANVMDYDDLLELSVRLLREDDGIRAYYQQQFQHVLVDEYQDTSSIQASLTNILAEFHRQIMAVGDDAQSIYSWRGANFKNILSFPERYPDARVIRIETNYRSSPEILNLANYAIAANTQQFKKELRSTRPANRAPKPALVCLGNGNQQAQFIAQRIGELFEEGVELNEIAVLYRSHFHSLEVQMELTRRNIPFELTSGLRFFEQAHVKDVSAYLKLALNPKDELAFKRIASMLPGVGAKTADKLWDKVQAGTPLAEVKPPTKAVVAWKQWADTQQQISQPELKDNASQQIQIVIDAVYQDYMQAKYTNWQSRLEDLNQLRAFSETFESAGEFLAQLALLTNVDVGPKGESSYAKNTSAEPKIRLSTIHQAKGLEWKAVFVIMLCDGMFPSSRSSENEEGLEEERRLFYVAVTRAKDELYLTYPVLRSIAGGDEKWQEPSRFLNELPRELTNQWKIVGPTPNWS